LTYDPPETANNSVTSQFLEPKGEVLFYKRPADGLKMTVTLDKAVAYLPGDTVSYTVNIYSASTNKLVTTDTYVSLSVVDVNGVNNLTQTGQNILTR
jgi:hypothetical protein